MRIRKRPVSQCGASPAAGMFRHDEGGSSALDHKQFTPCTRSSTEKELSESCNLLAIHAHGSELRRPSSLPYSALDINVASTIPSPPEQLLRMHNRGKALLLQDDRKLCQQLQVQKWSSTKDGTPVATPPSTSDHAKRIAKITSPGAPQQLHAEVDCTLTMSTAPRERLLQTGGTCYTVPAAHPYGQVTESNGLHFEIDLERQISSSLPIFKDHDRLLKKQVLARNFEDNVVKASIYNDNTSKKLRASLPEAMDNLHMQERILTSELSDPQPGEDDNKVQAALNRGIEDYLRCGRRSGQGWQCKNKRAPDGGSIYCDYHQSKITQHRTAWITRKKNMKENKRFLKQRSWTRQNMVDVKVLELPLFPSKQHNCGNLQAQDKGSFEGGTIFKKMSQVASYSKVQRVAANVRSDDLDLKLAPNSQALPSLVETDMPTKPTCVLLSWDTTRSPVFETYSLKRRKFEGEATSKITSDVMSEHDHHLTDVNITCAGREHLNTIKVFGSSSSIKHEQNETSTMSKNNTIGIITTRDIIKDARDVGLESTSVQEVKCIPDSALEQDQLLATQMRHSNLLVEEQQANGIEANEQGQQLQCKRHDGRGWRCKRICPPGKFYCEHHARKQQNYANPIKAKNLQNKDIELPHTIDDEMQHPLWQRYDIETRELRHEIKKGCLVLEPIIEPDSKLQVIKKGILDKRHNGAQNRTKQAVRTVSSAQRRCARHDGRGWQCKSKCTPGSIYCEHHKEKLRRNHAKWNAKCALKEHRLRPEAALQRSKTTEKKGQDLPAGNVDHDHSTATGKGKHCIGTVKVVQSKTDILRDALSTKEEQETAEEDDADRKESNGEQLVEAAQASALWRRKRRFLHHIYARCIAPN
ncbi:hypothetical protein L7F22_069326 [Adiantum nelumboides]|nr:hypothetical protein [Adiantum nelumboides]